ncbi:MAG: RluA family pseudouridine synthase [Patescibacteria group bacterium]
MLLYKMFERMQEPRVIYEDENFIALNKPAGLLVHSQKIKSQKSKVKIEEATLVDWLLDRYPGIKTIGDDPETRPGIVHRLDRDTSGVLLVAKTQKSFEYLKSLFQKREIKKTYLAWVLGVPKEKCGVINTPIGIQSGSTKRSVRSAKMSKPAVTRYKVLQQRAYGKEQIASLLEVMPETGRTHQIRVHLASIGHPVAGDPLYGRKLAVRSWQLGVSKKKNELTTNHQLLTTRLMLHALSVEFTAQDGKRLKIEAEPPPEFSL